jgi:hypothetical protein
MIRRAQYSMRGRRKEKIQGDVTNRCHRPTRPGVRAAVPNGPPVVTTVAQGTINRSSGSVASRPSVPSHRTARPKTHGYMWIGEQWLNKTQWVSDGRAALEDPELMSELRKRALRPARVRVTQPLVPKLVRTCKKADSWVLEETNAPRLGFRGLA